MFNKNGRARVNTILINLVPSNSLVVMSVGTH